jgi:hypothetical protein
MMLTQPEQIQQFRARALLRGLKLETLGMARRGQSCYSIIKTEYGLKGSKQKVYDQFKKILDMG